MMAYNDVFWSWHDVILTIPFLFMLSKAAALGPGRLPPNRG